MTAPAWVPRRPAALRSGSRLAVVSPASMPKPEDVQRGIKRLEGMGYEMILSPHALDRGPLNYAGKLKHRLADLHAAFADPSIDGIICTRGGWGSAELLPYLEAALICTNPKVFIGYSDHTSLHCWLQNEANLITFYGPMVAADFAREGGVNLPSWQHSVRDAETWSLGKEAGLRVLRPGLAQGVLRGGCLSLLTESMGTAYEANTADSILFLEDVGTKPYQWDRMLLHLRYAGRLGRVRGVVFGDMNECVAPEEQEYLDKTVLHALRDFEGPIAIGLRCGHVKGGNITLPLGVRVRLELTEAGDPQMCFLEAAVTV